MKRYTSLFLCILLSTFLHAQNSADQLIDKGTQLHDQGDYPGALGYFKQALAIEPNSPRAYYEMANTCFALKKYQDAIDHAQRVITIGAGLEDQAYVLEGTALDVMGRPDEAITVYRAGLKRSPGNTLLHYNVALTYLNQKKYKECGTHAAMGVMNNKRHPGSHMLLAYAMYDQGKRIPCILASWYFLLLENGTARSGAIREIMKEQYAHGVRQETPDSINVTVSHNSLDDKQFGPAEVMLSLLQAADMGEKKKATERERFYQNTKTLVEVLTKQPQDNPKNIWTDVYIPFFSKLADAGHMETFCAYVQYTTKDKSTDNWLKANTAKVRALEEWVKGAEAKRTMYR